MARVLLLLPSHSYRAHDFLAAATKVGVEVVIGSNRRQALGELSPGTTLTVDFGDLPEATARILDLAEEYPLQAVIGADDDSTQLAADAAKALGLPHNPAEAVAATRSKFKLREALRRAGLPSPGYRLIDLATDSEAVPSDISFPCVVKPTFLSASRGVIRADDADQLVDAIRQIAAILDDPEARRLGGAEADKALVEDYIPGVEFALEAILSQGKLHVLALFDKPDPLEGPYFEETIYLTPSRAAEAVRRQIVQTVESAIGAVGLREGPIHAELRVNDSDAYTIDLAARAIGGLCPRVLRFGTGMSLEELILRHAIGEDFSSFERERIAAGVMMIPIPAAGVLEGVSGLESARRLPSIEEITISIPGGQPVLPLPEGNRYLGFIFARDPSPERVEAALRDAHRRLEIKIKPAG